MRGWIAVFVTACVLPQPYPYPYQPAPPQQPMVAPRPGPAPAPSAPRRAERYDELQSQLIAAEQLGDEDAAHGEREVVHGIDDLLRELARDPRADSALVANARALRVRAAGEAAAAFDRFIETLATEVHAHTGPQLAVLRQHGRPEVAKQCWIYRRDAGDETYCWTKAGKLASHKVTGPEPVAEAPEPAPAAPAAPRGKHAIAYYAAATFASGSCSFGNCLKDGWTTRTAGGDVESRCDFGDCAKDGWTSRHPDGTESRTSCSFGDCFKDGWTTTHPDGTSSSTSCSFGDCMKDGWTTTMPDGSSSTTSCSFGDCLKDGWTTQLPSGQSVSCSCNFGDCLQNGASCN
ncbi:MAG TPA: hypothetical protein VGF94_12290 [Kofleriaceae bacterium]|jgi:hypothetical protein